LELWIKYGNVDIVWQCSFFESGSRVKEEYGGSKVLHLGVESGVRVGSIEVGGERI
jgi:hypothetical protein